jgi:hypothetical protein
MIAPIFTTIKFVHDKIKADLSNFAQTEEVEKRLEQLIDLYNQQNDYEEGSSNYVFNINKAEDVDYLFSDYKGGEDSCHYKEPRVAELSLMVVNRNSDYFTLCEEKAYFLHEDEIRRMIEEKVYELAQFLFRHPEDNKELWEAYVTRYLDKE